MRVVYANLTVSVNKHRDIQENDVLILLELYNPG